MGISTVLLAYKEAENLRFLLPQIKEQLEKIGEEYEILVIDVEKPLDDTAAVCKEFGAQYFNQELPHFGGAFQTGIRHATMDKFLILDSDGSHNPQAIPAIYKAFCAGADMVIGSRYVKGGVSNDSKVSFAMSQILNTLFRFALQVKARDISTDYRMYHTEELKKTTLFCENYDILQEVILKLKLQKDAPFIIDEVPITFNKRVFGESKRSLLKFILCYVKTIVKLTTLRLVSKKDKNPAKCEQQAELFTNVLMYGGIGVLAAVLDFALFALLNAVIHVPEISNIFGAIGGFFFSFYFNTFYNFQKSDKVAKRFVSYGAICVLGAALSTTIIHLCKQSVNLYALKAIALVIASIFQFVLNKLVTYTKI